MPKASDVTPGSDLANAMLPSLGFFGGTSEDCLRISVDPEKGAITKLRLERADDRNDFLNLRGVLVQYDGEPVEIDAADQIVSQSSNRSANKFGPLQVTALTGLHTEREVHPWWQMEFPKGLLGDQVLLFNRRDEWGIRERSLRLFVEQNGIETVVYDSRRASLHTTLPH